MKASEARKLMSESSKHQTLAILAEVEKSAKFGSNVCFIPRQVPSEVADELQSLGYSVFFKDNGFLIKW